jgi:predicted nuclease of predicted toxin-antitoxin system
MAVKFKVDEDLPNDVATVLRGAGFDALSVVEQGLTGTPDKDLFPIVQHEERCLMTADKGFGDVRVYAPGTHCGVVLLRLPRESRAGYIQLAEFMLKTLDLEQAQGSLVVVSPENIRVHRKD